MSTQSTNPYTDDNAARAEVERLYMLKSYTPQWIASYVRRDLEVVTQWIQEYLGASALPSFAPPTRLDDVQQRMMKLRAALDSQIAQGSVIAIRTALQIEIELARLAGLYADDAGDEPEQVQYQITGIDPEKDLT